MTEICHKFTSGDWQCKNYYNRLRFAKVIDRSLLSAVYGPQCV